VFKLGSYRQCVFDCCVCRVEMKYDANNRPYYVDHNTRTTSWTRPTPLPPGSDLLSVFFSSVIKLLLKKRLSGARISQRGVWDYLSEPVTAETFTHSHLSWSSITLYLLLPSTMIRSLHSCQSFCTTSLQVLFGLPLGLAPSTSYAIHFFIQSLCSFRNTCPYHRNLFCCSTENPSFSLNSILRTQSFT